MAGIGELDVKLDPQSLLTDHVKVDYITVDAPLLDVRMLGGKTNFKALQDRLNMAPAPDTAESNLTLTIKKIKVKAPQLSVTSDGMLSGQKDVKLADFEITNLGTDEQGLAPREIARHVMDVLQPQIAKALIEMGASDKVQDLAGDAKGKLEKGLGGMLEKLKNKK